MMKNITKKLLQLTLITSAISISAHATNQFKNLKKSQFIKTSFGSQGMAPRFYTNIMKSLIDNMADDDLILITPAKNTTTFNAPYKITYNKTDEIHITDKTQELIDVVEDERFQQTKVKAPIVEIYKNGSAYEKSLIQSVIQALYESQKIDNDDPFTNIEQLTDEEYGLIAADYTYFIQDQPWRPEFAPKIVTQKELPTNVEAINEGRLFTKKELQQQLQQEYINQAFQVNVIGSNSTQYKLKKANDQDQLQKNSFIYLLAKHGGIAQIKAPQPGPTNIKAANVAVDAAALMQKSQAILLEMTEAQDHNIQEDETVSTKLNAWDDFVDEYVKNLQADDQTNAALAKAIGVDVNDNQAVTLTGKLKQLFAASYTPAAVFDMIKKMTDQIQTPAPATENNNAITITTKTQDGANLTDILQAIQNT